MLINKLKILALLVICFGNLALFMFVWFNNGYKSNSKKLTENIDNTDFFSFENFDNENGYNRSIVPNIVHLIYFQKSTPKNVSLKFHEMINIFSIFFNHNPDLIYLHCDYCLFSGKYWSKIRAYEKLWKIIRFNYIPPTNTIFGVKYGNVNHRSDVYRILILMNYGGIYLDNDVYVINSLNKYLKYEMTVSSRLVGDNFGNMVLIGHRNARFLKAYYDSYRYIVFQLTGSMNSRWANNRLSSNVFNRYNYTPSLWYWNAGNMAAKLLNKHLYMAHTVKSKLGTDMLIHKLYKTYWLEWKEFDTVHLLINHRSYLDKNSPIRHFDEFNIQNYNYTYGYMVREILDKMKTQ